MLKVEHEHGLTQAHTQVVSDPQPPPPPRRTLRRKLGSGEGGGLTKTPARPTFSSSPGAEEEEYPNCLLCIGARSAGGGEPRALPWGRGRDTHVDHTP